ncbi:hypothetical protein SEA_VANLEE_41 [Gordonia phage VanLee]|uniref:Uncharacterized protein n=1 Tax=Gordonia phage VanLee TaxID=2845816 RepID=A0A8F2D9N6_9CAUD|nr:kinase [Gordonia phage VanLee]QWS68158.1 hypothetical protein SEA_VANLEE_41 [Gordonia phage VanLee]
MPELNRRGEPIVRLYTRDSSIIKKVTEWFTAEGVEIKVIEAVPPRGFTAQFLLHTCSLNSSVEKAAARVGGMPAVIPEALDYVLGKCQESKVSAMVGHDWARNKLI